MNRLTHVSPKIVARTVGVFYLLVIVTSPLAMAIRNGLIVRGDAAASAANILAHEPLYRLGAVADVVSSACYIVVTGLFYVLFRPVSRSVALIAVLFSVVAIAISAFAVVLDIAPLAILDGSASLGAFTDPQLQQLALLCVRLGGQGVNLGIVFFGFYCLTTGWLIFKSGFLPPILGAGMALAGAGWLSFLYPPLSIALTPWNMASSGLGEGALTLWLLAFGINAERWNEEASPASPQARATTTPGVVVTRPDRHSA